MIDVWGADRVGAAAVALWRRQWQRRARSDAALHPRRSQSLNPLGLAYLHFIEPRSSGAGRAEVNHQNVPSAMVLFRPIWNGVLMTAGGFTGESRERCDRRWPCRRHRVRPHLHFQPGSAAPPAARIPLTPYNRATFYGGDVAGYTDYPEHDE